MRRSSHLVPFLLTLACVALAMGAAAALRAEPARAAVASPSCLCLDWIPPVTTSNYDGLWHNSPVTVTFRATDGGSGVAYTEFSSNNGCTWTRGTSVTVSAMGVTPILYRSADIAGNLEFKKSLNVKVLGVALYAGADSSMSGAFKVTSPWVSSQPSAALYVNGKLTTGTSVNPSQLMNSTRSWGDR